MRALCGRSQLPKNYNPLRETEAMFDDVGATTGITAEEFKRAMRRFAASVNVITTREGNTMNGMTATAVCSVSAEPPSLLIIVNRSNRSHPIIIRTRTFTVNMLAEGQEHLAAHFASRPADPFEAVPHCLGSNGCPSIDGADAHLECFVSNQFDSGSHTIFIGKIVATWVTEGVPLLYHDGSYRSLGGTTKAA